MVSDDFQKGVEMVEINLFNLAFTGTLKMLCQCNNSVGVVHSVIVGTSKLFINNLNFTTMCVCCIKVWPDF